MEKLAVEEKSHINGKKKNLLLLKNLEDVYELSPLQKEILSEYIKHPRQGVFHENLVFNFEGTVDADIFKKCWDKIIERHSILRTSFVYRGMKEPVQVVNRKTQLTMHIYDWREKSPQEQEETLTHLSEKDRNTDYCLEKAPLMRLGLIIRSDHSFSLWWRFHHITMDGWAFTVVLWDLLALYRSFLEGETTLSLLPGYPYKEYINYLKRRDTRAEEAFWPEYLKGFKPPKPFKNLKAPSPGSVATLTRQSRIDYPIEELFVPLQKLIKSNEVTLNSVFQGIFTLLMSHYSGGETDMITGQTVADRPLALENSHARVGLCINTIPIRYKIQYNEGFVQWIKRLQTSMMNAFRFSGSSEQDIKRWCGIEENTPIFNSALVFKNIPLMEDPFRGLPFYWTGWSLESRPHFPVSVFVWPDENLELKIIYDNKLFAYESAWEILENIKKALQRLIDNPLISVAELAKF